MRSKLFRPSSAPALEICTHFHSLEKETDETETGDLVHRDCASIFKGTKVLEDIPKSRRDEVAWTVSVQKEDVPWVTGVERKIDIYGQADQFITSGTIDLDGETEFEGIRIPSLLDHKPGDYIDRTAQLTTYALARMDEAGSHYCQMTTAFYKQGHLEGQGISYPYAQGKVAQVVKPLQGAAGPERVHISIWV